MKIAEVLEGLVSYVVKAHVVAIRVVFDSIVQPQEKFSFLTLGDGCPGAITN